MTHAYLRMENPNFNTLRTWPEILIYPIVVMTVNQQTCLSTMSACTYLTTRGQFLFLSTYTTQIHYNLQILKHQTCLSATSACTYLTTMLSEMHNLVTKLLALAYRNNLRPNIFLRDTI